MLFTVTAFADSDQPEETDPTGFAAESVIAEETTVPDETAPEGITIEDDSSTEETQPTDPTEVPAEITTVPEETVTDQETVPSDETAAIEQTEQIEDLFDYESVAYEDADYTLYVVVDHEVRTAPDQNADVAVILVKDTPVHVVKSSAFSPWVGIEINGQIYYINATVLSCYTSDHNDNSFIYWSDSEAEERWIG